METSAFMDKDRQPSEEDIKRALEHSYHAWQEIKEFALAHFAGSSEEWKYSKAGWNGRIKQKKGVVVYFMPGIGSFRLSFVFGGKATELALASHIDEEIKTVIKEAPVYAEGSGFRIEIADKKMVPDIKKLLLLKAG